jgi:hypothetical protein
MSSAGLGGARMEHGGDQVVVRELAQGSGVEAADGDVTQIYQETKRFPLTFDLGDLIELDQVASPTQPAECAHRQVAYAPGRGVDDDPGNLAESLPLNTKNVELRQDSCRALNPGGIQVRKFRYVREICTICHRNHSDAGECNRNARARQAVP